MVALLSLPGTRRNNLVINRSLLLLLLVSLCVAGVWVTARGTASVLALQGGRVASEAGDDRAALAYALRIYGWAFGLDGLNPGYLENRGRILEQLAQGQPFASPEAAHLLEGALALYREASIRRPSWPYVYLSVARVKLKLGALDEEFGRSLRLAWVLGGWSLRVQLDLLEIGFAAWPLLNAERKELVGSVLTRALGMQPRPVLTLALRLGRRDLVEPFAERDDRLRRILDAGLRAAGRP